MSKKNNKPQFPLMPKATAVWLVENTGLTFKQIADFCGIHELEVKGIADGEVGTGIMGVDPINAGQLDKDVIDSCVANPKLALKLKLSDSYTSPVKKGAKYTPIARRQDKPDAIYWLVKNFPTIKDSDIIKLVGTTKTTVAAIKDRSHWNMSNIRQRDPVLLGICSQIDLDRVTARSEERRVGKECSP